MGILLLRSVNPQHLEMGIPILISLLIVLIICLVILALIQNMSTRYDKRVALKNARKKGADGIEALLQKLHVIKKLPGEINSSEGGKLIEQRLAALKRRDVVDGAKLLDYEISNERFLLLLELFKEGELLGFFPVTRRHTFFYALEINSGAGEISLHGDEDLRRFRFHEDLGIMVDLCPGWLAKELLGR
jgi:hypothetical protein